MIIFFDKFKYFMKRLLIEVNFEFKNFSNDCCKFSKKELNCLFSFFWKIKLLKIYMIVIIIKFFFW